MPTYPGSNIVAPTDLRPGTTDKEVTHVRLSSRVDHAIILRPLHKGAVRNFRSPIDGGAWYVYACDMYDLATGSIERTLVGNPAIVPYLDTALQGETVTAGTVKKIGSGLLLEPLSEGDQRRATEAVDRLGWGTSPNYSARVGKQIKALRTAAGESQERLAEFLGMSVSGVSDIENGKRTVSVDTAMRTAVFLGLPVGALF
ncbi:helix-turn-helix transcriptional regulator [Mycobacterium koreense]|uniref:Uncharacterized protein n=1 Tax=Mycolicibacillus koreensis TaxID=1069220 RepID=A0A7I7SBJ8_9MYCO|nr:helix-turn-helix transcriptional regulator [Mycolicibacillus koreensis]MCV7247708.1 helix-turn-helix transcriptional regulator [Mycolicibacillus koreensis]OSC34759.1 hypothetical protein B8W67_05795 [Mycolicibacillus koreensis]BBY54093.1 hypothetical protein MKOR_13440 [Mycolicibacillus koreensis]